MRLVQVLVPDEHRDEVIEVLEERKIDYFVASGDGRQGDRSMLQFPVPTNAVESILEALRDAGLDEDAYTVVASAEFAVGRHLDDLRERYASLPTHIAPAELRSKAKDLRPGTRAFVWMMFLSAIVATAGLLAGSPAVIVGSMVIAPIVSPALTASIGALRNDWKLFVDSIWMQGYGMALAIITATGFGFFLRLIGIVPPMLDVSSLQFVSVRVAPGLLSLAVALAAGAAAAYGLATTGSTSIVGVMIAAALIPTAATTGIGIAWRSYVLAVGAFVLLLVNVLSINVAAFLMLSYLEYGSITSRLGLFALGSRRRIVVSALVVAVVAALLVGTVTVTTQQIRFDRQVNGAVTETLDADRYSSLQLSGVRTEYAAFPFDSAPVSVRVAVLRSGEKSDPRLPSLLAARIEERTGQNVSVEVVYTSVGRGGSPPANATTANASAAPPRPGLSSRGPEASPLRGGRRSPRPSWTCRGSC